VQQAVEDVGAVLIEAVFCARPALAACDFYGVTVQE
jgi:hypothetical protein